MYPFVYKIEALDELREDHKVFHEGGIVYAKTFAGAAAKLEEYYGEKNIVEIRKLLPLLDDPIVLPLEVLTHVENEDFNSQEVREYVY